ncbi:MAG: hypothetical protein ACR2P2_10450 [Nakamurella sp.]
MARPRAPIVVDDAAMLVRGRALAAANDEQNPTAVYGGTSTVAGVEKEMGFSTNNRGDEELTVLAVAGSFTHYGRKPRGAAFPTGTLLMVVTDAKGNLADFGLCTRDIAEFASAMHLKRLDR